MCVCVFLESSPRRWHRSACLACITAKKLTFQYGFKFQQREHVTFKIQVSTLVHIEHVIDFDNLKSMKQVFSSLIVQKYTWPTLFMLYNYALSMVLASVEDERSISLAKLIETDLRSLLTDEAKTAVGRIANCGLTASQFLESSLCEKAVDVWYAAGVRLVKMPTSQPKSEVLSG